MNTYSPSQAYQRFNSSTAVLLKPHQPTKVVAVPLLPQRVLLLTGNGPSNSASQFNLVIVTIIYSLFIILTIQAVLRFITNQQKKQSGSEYCYHPTRSLLPTLLNLTLSDSHHHLLIKMCLIDIRTNSIDLDLLDIIPSS
ncbi:hypothetical protein H4Q26_000485 [Puccinia striiformis f. sp. tritici PST-130]|nr:hypothetical protein H4Q26_000485 [Puccinia striiformis f. sp. tritici PST-130]